MRIIRRSLLSGAAQAEGIAVVIDVLRAFTCSALMFHYGLEDLRLVRTPEEALAQRDRDSRYLAAGEVSGVKVPGFDIGNSPAEIVQRGRETFAGRRAVLRSSAGVQGVLTAAEKVEKVVLGSYVTASAIARYLQAQARDDLPVTIIGMGYGGQEKTIEDESCGDYIEHLLTGKTYDHLSALWSNLTDPAIAASLQGDVVFRPREDIMIALQRDLFDFVLVVDNTGGDQVVARRVDV